MSPPGADAGSVSDACSQNQARVCVGYKKDGFLVVTGLPEYGGMTINTSKCFSPCAQAGDNVPSFWPKILTHQSWWVTVFVTVSVTVSRMIPWDKAVP